ncbi:helix-turn-helix domain-containing protein [Roseburia hominis]
MSVKFKMLLKELDSICPFQYVGNGEIELYAIQIFQFEVQTQKNVLYIADTAEVLPTKIPTNIPAVFVEKNQVYKVFHTLQNTLIRALKQELLLEKIRTAQFSDENIEKIAELFTALIGNPVVFYDQDLKVLTYSGTFDNFKDDYYSLPHSVNPYISNGEMNPFILPADKEHKNRSMICFLRKNNTIAGGFLVEEKARIFSPTDIYYAQKFSEIFSSISQSKLSSSKNNAQELLFTDLLKGEFLSPFALDKLKKLFRISKDTTLYLLLIDTAFQTDTIMLQESLAHILRNKVFRYQHYYVTLLPIPLKGCILYNPPSGFVDFITKHRLFASLSNGYTDLNKTSIALNQCLRTLKIGYNIRKSQHFYRFEDQMIYYMFSLIGDENALMDLCHPIIQQIYEYDQQHQTEYIRTLGAYILLEKSIKRCADALYIHRNTMINRIDKIKSLFKIDFSDSRMKTKLHMSVLILGYLGKVDLFVQPLLIEMDSSIL